MINIERLKSQLKEKDVLYCVYELYYGKELLYVGSTKRLSARLQSHCVEKKGLFSHVKYTECAPSEMLSLEAEAIFTLKPIMNMTLPSNTKYAIKSSLLKEVKEHISNSITSMNCGSISVTEWGKFYDYVDVDKQAELLLIIDEAIKNYSGGENKIPDILNSISTVRYKADDRYSYNYAGAISGLVVTDIVDGDDFARKLAYREAVALNKDAFVSVINKDHSLALIMNDSDIYKKELLK